MLFALLMLRLGREHDMDWGQFSIMFRSIFEGLGGRRRVRLILKTRCGSFGALGGEPAAAA
jgi:hypothetical protein